MCVCRYWEYCMYVMYEYVLHSNMLYVHVSLHLIVSLYYDSIIKKN